MPGINDIAALVAEEIGVPKKDAKEAVEATLAAIKTLSLEGTVSCSPLGNFKIKTRAAAPAREGRNPFNGDKVKIAAKPEREVLTFKPTDKLVERPKKSKKPVKEEKSAAKKSAKETKPVKRGRR